MITENGCMDTPGEGLNDETRITYLREHLQMLSLSSSCNVMCLLIYMIFL